MGERIALLPAGLTAIAITAPGVGAIMTIFLSALAISAAAIVWFSLLIRKALLLVAIVFGPIALAGATWDAAKGWFSKWVAFVIALILSKLVLVVIFLVAVAQVSAPIDADLASVSDPIAGIVLMFIAAFAPYITYKFLSFVGFDLHHAMTSEQEAKSAMNRPVPVPTAPMTDGVKKVLGPSGDHGSGEAGKSGPPSPAPPKGTGTSTPPTSAGPTTAPTGASTPGTTGTAAGMATAGVTVGAAVVEAAAESGPRLGDTIAHRADAHTQAADHDIGPGSSASNALSSPSGTPPASKQVQRDG
jgi:type IV secretion system protein TrbL